MGSFNIVCPISGLSITSDTEVMYFLMTANYDAEKPIKRKGCLVSNDGMYMYFYPMAMPFVCKYDDYGTAEAVVRDANTEAIEKYFNVKIETIIKYMRDKDEGHLDNEDWEGWEGVKNKEQLSEGVSLMVRKDVYDSMSEPIDFLKSSYVKDCVLEKLGFEFIREDNKIDKRYNKVYKYPTDTRYLILSDTTWIRLYDTTTKKTLDNLSVYHPDTFIKAFKKLTGISVPTDHIDNSLNSNNFDMLKKHLAKNNILETTSSSELLKSNPELFEELSKSNPELLEALQTVDRYAINELFYDFGLYVTPHNYSEIISDIYINNIATSADKELSELKSAFVKYCDFISSIRGLDIIFFPNLYGSQHDNFKEKIKFNKIINKIAKKELSEYEY